jgi:hypothetical protein
VALIAANLPPPWSTPTRRRNWGAASDRKGAEKPAVELRDGGVMLQRGGGGWLMPDTAAAEQAGFIFAGGSSGPNSQSCTWSRLGNEPTRGDACR